MDRHRAYRQITRAVIGEYPDRMASLETLPERIATERARLTAIRSSAAESQMQPSGAGNVRQERDTAILCEIDRLTAVLEETKREVDLVRRCLAGLDDRQLRTIEVMDMQPRYRAAEMLAEEFSCDRATVYRIHDTALDTFARLYYGA